MSKIMVCLDINIVYILTPTDILINTVNDVLSIDRKILKYIFD